MTTGYVAIVALSALVVAGVIALIVIESWGTAARGKAA